jgi:glutamate decarboxylase
MGLQASPCRFNQHLVGVLFFRDLTYSDLIFSECSGHKFGLAYVGVGWVIWRDKVHLPKDLIFELHYLGSVEYSFSLNFSRPAAPIIAQYFNFLHLGFEGYRTIAIDDFKNARLLSRALEKSGYYYVLSDIHRPLEGLVSTAKVATGYDQEDIEVRFHILGMPG